jgi:hypothetical protein
VMLSAIIDGMRADRPNEVYMKMYIYVWKSL